MAGSDKGRLDEEIDAAIRARIDALGERRLIEELKREGQSVVYLDGAAIVREAPDGSRQVVGRLGEESEQGDGSV